MFKAGAKAFPALLGILFCSASVARAEWDFWGVTYSGDVNVGHRVWTIDSETGDATLRTTKLFAGNSWQWANSYVDRQTGELVVYESDDGLHAYDLETNTWTDRGKAFSYDYQEVFSRPLLEESANGTVEIGTGENPTTINSEGISVGGSNLIKRSNGTVSIGENSLKLREEGSRQQMWATDANGDSIDIDIVNSSDLLINGQSVQGQINSNDTDIASNASSITTNVSAISSNISSS